MIRYTIKISNNADLNIVLIQRQLEDRLSRNNISTRIRLSKQFGARGIILLETDVHLNKPVELMAELKFKTNVDAIEVQWGWVIPAELQEYVSVDETENDPLYNATPITDANKVATYAYSLIGKVFLLVNLSFLLLGIGILYSGYSSSQRILTWFGLLIISIFAYATLNLLLSIKTDANGIAFRFLIKPTIKMNWPEIDCLKIFQARGEWCAIYSVHQKIELPLARIYDETTKHRLLRSIINNANLHLVESSPDRIVYRRASIAK